MVRVRDRSLMVKGPVFHGTRFDIVDANGEKWITVKQLAEALGYANYQQLHNLINRNKPEFPGKTCVVEMTIQGQRRHVTTINYHGCIRAAMLSDAPRARECPVI